MLTDTMATSLTLDEVLAFGPCKRDGSTQWVTDLFAGREAMTVADLDKLPFEALSVMDRLWLLLRPEILGERNCHLLLCEFAENALIREREAGREPDPRSWAAIRVKRRWVDGLATSGDLWAASAASAASAGAAAAAAWAAMWAAGREERCRQYELICRVLRGEIALPLSKEQPDE